MLKKFFYIIWFLIVIILIAAILIPIVIKKPNVQNYIVDKAVSYINKKTNSKIEIENVEVEFFNKLLINNVLLLDNNNDTLIIAETITAKINYFNFWEKNLTVKSIALKNAKIKLYKSENDSTFNFEEIAKNFSSSNNAESETDNENDNNNEDEDWKLALEEIKLLNTKFDYLDATNVILFQSEFKSAIFQLSKTDEYQNFYAFDKVTLDAPKIYFQSYYYDKNYKKPFDEITHINDSDLGFLIENLEITNADLQIVNDRNENLVSSKFVDFNNLHLKKVNANIENFELKRDEILANIQNLSVDFKNGLRIKKFKSDLEVTAKKLYLSNLELQFNQSKISKEVKFRFKTLNHFQDFVNEVKIDVDFENTSIVLADLQYFFDLKNTLQYIDYQRNDELKLNGNFKGTINNLKGRNAAISLGNHSKFKGSFSGRNLTDPNKTFLDLKVENFETALKQLDNFYGIQKFPKQLLNLNWIKFDGKFTGFYKDFVAYGNLDSELGKITSDLNLKNGKNGLPKYSGAIVLKDFDVGKLIERENEIGKISLNAKIKGSGLTIEDLNSNIEGTIDKINVANVNYENIEIKGNVIRKEFKGNFSINDPKLKIDFDGNVNLNNEFPELALETKIDNLDFKQLEITEENFTLTSDAKLHFKGSNLDNFEGEAILKNVKLGINNKNYEFESIELNAFEEYNERVVDLKSDVANANFRGDFMFEDVHYAFQNILISFFKMQIFDVVKPQANANVKFDVVLNNADFIKQNWLPDLSDSLKLIANGKINTATNFIDAEIKSKQFGYDEVTGNDLNLNITTDNNKLKLLGNINEIYIADSLGYENTEFIGSVYNNQLTFDLKSNQKNTENDFTVNGLFTVSNDTLILDVERWLVNIKDKTFKSTSGNFKYLNKQVYEIKDFVISSEDQVLYVKTENENNKVLTFIEAENIDLLNIAALVPNSNLNLKGTLNGNITVEDLFVNPNIEGAFKIDTFAFNDIAFGDFNYIGYKEPGKKQIKSIINLVDNDNEINAEGTIDYLSSPQKIDFIVEAKKASLKLLESFTGKTIENTSGSINGNVIITGTTTKPKFNGQLYINNAKTTINYLKTTYSASKDTLYLNGSNLVFPVISLYDEFGSKANLSGNLSFGNMQKLSTEVFIEAANPFQFLNTKKVDNKYFYGEAFATGNVFIEGDFTDLDILVNATTQKGTNIRLPLTADEEIKEANFFKFINTGVNTIKIDESEVEDFSKFTFYGDFDITEDALTQIIFNEQSGDIIKSRGNANVKVELNTLGDFNIFGNYNITEGDYLFTLQNLMNKKFSVKKGGSVSWSGDPYEAIIDINAVYEKSTKFIDLLNDQENLSDEVVNALNNRRKAFVNLKMENSLTEPDISLSIETEETGNSLADISLKNRLEEINADDANLNKQLVGLMILNRFVPYNTNLEVNGNIGASGFNTLSELFFNQINIYASDFFSELLNDDIEVDLNYQRIDDDESSSNQLGIALGKKLLNDRLYISIGSNLQLDEKDQDGQDLGNSFLLDDFLIEYFLTKDEKFKVKAFNKSDYNVVSERYNKTGIGLSYRQSYHKYSDIFKRKKKRKSNN